MRISASLAVAPVRHAVEKKRSESKFPLRFREDADHIVRLVTVGPYFYEQTLPRPSPDPCLYGVSSSHFPRFRNDPAGSVNP
ncbi:hypothetical protein VTO42DRAFT_8542 [Malbranchea cinnamomea]